MTLPTREIAKTYARRLAHEDYDFVPEIPATFQAIADGVLMTREEWLATIDYEAAIETWVQQSQFRMSYEDKARLIRIAVDAAVGEEEQ